MPSARPPEVSAEAAWAKAVSPIDFDVDTFTYLMRQDSAVIQDRFLAVFVSYIDRLAYDYDTGIINARTVQARRIQDALDPYQTP